MANIDNELNKIKNAVYGKDVRGAIHDGIEKVYNDATKYSGEKDMEVVLARGSHSNLNDRLNETDQQLAETDQQLAETDQQLAETAKKSEVRLKSVKNELEDMSPTVLAAIEGGEDTVFNLLSVPQDGSVTPDKTTFIEKTHNLFDGNYRNGFVTTNGQYRNDLEGKGRLAVLEVDPNTSYYVKVFRQTGTDNRFAISQLSGSPIYEDGKYRGYNLIGGAVVHNPTLDEFEFTTAPNAEYIIIAVSAAIDEPDLLVTKSVNNTSIFLPKYIIPTQYNFPLLSMIEELRNDISDVVPGTGSGVETYNQLIVRKSDTNFTNSLLILDKTTPFIIDTLQFGWGGIGTEGGLQLKISVGSESVLEPSNGSAFFINTANNLKLYDNPHIDILTYDTAKNTYLFNLNVQGLRFDEGVKIELIKVNDYAGNPSYTVELIGRDVSV